MNYNITALQIGQDDYSETYEIDKRATWVFTKPEEFFASIASEQEEPQTYDVILITSPINVSVGQYINRIGMDYCILYLSQPEIKECSGLRVLRRRKSVRAVPEKMMGEILSILPQIFFQGQYGAKLGIEEIEVNQEFTSMRFRGHEALILEENFGVSLRPALSWRYNVPMKAGEPLEIWLEYSADSGVDLELVVRANASGSVDGITKTWRFRKELHQYWATVLESDEHVLLTFSLRVKGRGKLEVGNLHYRYSRMGASVMLMGGKKYQDNSHREEFYSLLEMMDRKPPLNVYFSGYRTAESFEGYNMMKKLGAPFLLIGDPRLEGGAFYIGSDEFEEKVRNAIEDALKKLRFTNDQLILSGISMGSFGAAYYSADLKPHSTVLGKPLMNLGNVARAEKSLRPGGFPTSLDLLLKMTGGLEREHITKLNNRLWDKFDYCDFRGTDFAIAYMKEDDYDPDGYPDLVKHLAGKDVTIYGKGVTGRHNDNTSAVVEWFVKRYKRILEASFGRTDANLNKT